MIKVRVSSGTTCHGCGRVKEHRARLCMDCHVAKVRREADLLMPARFWAKVEQRGPAECWPFRGCVSRSGYGAVGSRAHPETIAHRLAYILAVGPIPDGMDLDHLCHNADTACTGGASCLHRRCVNPAHLEPATRRDNALRGRGPTARHARQSACVRDHPLAGANVRVYLYRGRETRVCRACERDRWQRRKAVVLPGGATPAPTPVIARRRAAA